MTAPNRPGNSSHKPQRETRLLQKQIGDLKKENHYLKRQLAQFKRENERLENLTPVDFEVPVFGAGEDSPVNEPTCPECKSADLIVMTLPSGKILEGCRYCKWGSAGAA